MSVDSANELKWKVGVSEPLTIMGAGTEELPYGAKYVVHIKPLITGHDHFMPSPGLKKKIEEINVDVGDVITVEKVAPSEKYQYGYFSVNVIQKSAIADSPVGTGFAQKDVKHKSDENFGKQFESKIEDGGKSDKLDLHELTLRVEKLEKMVIILSSEAGHKPGDEEIPF